MRIAVVGGGIVGVCISHELASLGASVELFEASARLGSVATAAAIGGITPLSDDFIRLRLAPICMDVFDAFWRLMAILDTDGQKPHLVDTGMMYLALSDKEAERLRVDFAGTLPPSARARWLTADEILSLEPGLHAGVVGALCIEDEPALNPMEFIAKMGQRLERNPNVRVRLNTPVTSLPGESAVEYVEAGVLGRTSLTISWWQQGPPLGFCPKTSGGPSCPSRVRRFSSATIRERQRFGTTSIAISNLTPAPFLTRASISCRARMAQRSSV